MAPKANLTMSANIEVIAREIDFVTRFGDTWESLREVLSVMRMIRKENGTVLKTKSASVVLQDGKVGEGEDIPYSIANVEETHTEQSQLRNTLKRYQLRLLTNTEQKQRLT